MNQYNQFKQESSQQIQQQQGQGYNLFPDKNDTKNQKSISLQLKEFNSFRQTTNNFFPQDKTINSPNLQLNNQNMNNINLNISNNNKQNTGKSEDLLLMQQKQFLQSRFNPEQIQQQSQQQQQKLLPKRANLELKSFKNTSKNSYLNQNKQIQQQQVQQQPVQNQNINDSNFNATNVNINLANKSKKVTPQKYNQFSNYLQQKIIQQQQQIQQEEDEQQQSEALEIEEDNIHIQQQKNINNVTNKINDNINDIVSQINNDVFTREISHDVYASKMLYNIIQDQTEEQFCPQDFLSNHTVRGTMRGKMVDWMIEVTNAYKCSDQTLFLSISIMDRFFDRVQSQQLTTDLHLIGVVSMFIASKYEDIIPIRLSTLQEKIAHNKFSKNEIQQKEIEVLTALDFCITGITLLDVVQLSLHQLDISMYLDEQGQKYFKKVVIYLAKMVSYEYELMSYFNYRSLAGACIYVAFKILEQFYHEFILVQLVQQLKGLLALDTQMLIKASTNLLYLARNFDQLHNSLTNLKKYNGVIFQELHNFRTNQMKNQSQQQQLQQQQQMQQQQQQQILQQQQQHENGMVQEEE